jgi:hypothetical protein
MGFKAAVFGRLVFVFWWERKRGGTVQGFRV